MTKSTRPPENDNSELKPSKSQLKRDMKKLQELGKQLADAPQDLIKKLNLEEELANALLLARRLGNDGSKRRQFQYIGKLLSQIDTSAITQLLDTYNTERKNDNTAFHRIEKLRDKLVKNGHVALNELIEEYDYLDRQHLAQLIRNAQKEAAQHKPPASSRAIFCYLRDNINNSIDRMLDNGTDDN